MKINFATGNSFKYELAKAFFDKLGPEYELVQYDLDIVEIQSHSVEEIAKQAAVSIAKEKQEPCIKVDVGFYIEALNGFPGPFIRFINEQLTYQDYLRLLGDNQNRNAYFLDSLAIGYPDGTAKVFTRKTKGTVATTVDVVGQWPANDLFIPDGYTRPLGQLSNDEQLKFWGDGSWPDVIKHFKNS
ncbi:MAG: non-canonical purine NTP pyrophosphatase [Candidatus Microsaccharimonas sp.]